MTLECIRIALWGSDSLGSSELRPGDAGQSKSAGKQPWPLPIPASKRKERPVLTPRLLTCLDDHVADPEAKSPDPRRPSTVLDMKTS